MIDQPSLPLAPQAAQILGLVIAPTTGTRASPPAAPVSGSSWRSLRPGAIGAIDGPAWTLVRYPGTVDDPDAGEWISCRTRRNRLAPIFRAALRCLVEAVLAGLWGCLSQAGMASRPVSLRWAGFPKAGGSFVSSGHRGSGVR